jgi:hypothetical protein
LHVPEDVVQERERKEELTSRVHARHLSGLTTNQGTASVEATGSDTLDDLGGDVDVQLRASKVVEEVERLSSLDNKVVDRHGNKIDSFHTQTDDRLARASLV